MKEIARIVSGLIALRIVQDNDGARRCEKFETGVWVEFTGKSSPPGLSADVKNWLEKHFAAEKQSSTAKTTPVFKKTKGKGKAENKER